MKRIKVAHESSSSSSNDIQHIDELPQELFQHCLEFVGKGNFAFVAPVSKHFYWNYISIGVPMENNMLTIDALLQLGRNKYTSAEVIATGSMRLATECFLKAPKEFKEAVCRYAAVNGRLDILQCAVAFGVEMSEAFYRSVPSMVIVNGHLDVIQFLADNGIDFNHREKFYEEVVGKGHAKDLHWMYTKGMIEVDRTDMAGYLARGGELDILKGHYPDCIWEEVFEQCSSGGHVELMNWMLEQEPEKCEWDENLFCCAAESGNIQMMELCLQNDCPISPRVCKYAMMNKKKEAALNALKWLRRNSIPWDEGVCTEAAHNGNLEALKWARENDCPWDISTFRYAVAHGDNFSTIALNMIALLILLCMKLPGSTMRVIHSRCVSGCFNILYLWMRIQVTVQLSIGIFLL